MALDESIIASVSNANFKACAEIPALLSNTASDSRNAASAALNVLTKRIAELDSVESAASLPIAAHSQQMAVASGAGMQSAQLGQSMLQLGNAQQSIQVQLAQLIALLGAQSGGAA